MDKDIKKLIERFMAGLTTVEEEDRIAEYFRTHEVSDQWQEYKEMFAWFDKGMPTSDRQAQDSTSKNYTTNSTNITKTKYNKRRWAIISTLAVAATLTFLLVLTATNKPHQDGTAINNTIATVSNSNNKNTQTDTISQDTIKETNTTSKKRSKHKPNRGTYKIMPPRTYIADAKTDSVTNTYDQLADTKIKEEEIKQETMINNIFDEYRRIETNIEIYMTALENYEDEEECY